MLTFEYGQALESAGGGFTAFEGDRVIAAAGIVTCWPGRGQVWALITPAMRARSMVIHRAVCRAIRAYEGIRLECVIDPLFEASVRWAGALGFEYESTMARYGIDGRTMDMYVHKRVRGA